MKFDFPWRAYYRKRLRGKNAEEEEEALRHYVIVDGEGGPLELAGELVRACNKFLLAINKWAYNSYGIGL